MMIFGCIASGNANHYHFNKNIKNNYDLEINVVIKSMVFEIQSIQNISKVKMNIINDKIIKIQSSLCQNINLENKVNLLIEKDILETELKNIKKIEIGEISKIRYIKGLEIIKILYEKVLGLDHHFASVRTFSEISKIANPKY